MKIYIAGPLYSYGEKQFNLHIDQLLRQLGHTTYLPQRDGGIITEMPDEVNGVDKYTYVYQKDLEEMSSADIFLYLLDGRVPDEGAAVALGYCVAHHVPCIGYKTDTRSLTNGQDNLMIKMSLKKILYNEEELVEYFK